MEEEFDIAKAEIKANSVPDIAVQEARSNAVAAGYDAQFNSPVVLTGNTGLGKSTYDTNVPFSELHQLDEIRAQRQPWIAKAGAGVGRVGVKVASEVAKMPGVLGGIVAGTVGQLQDVGSGQDNTNFMQTAFNSEWVKAINHVGEVINEEVLPVYVKKAVKEGNLWDNITAVDFWATEGADGLGYILSMLVPGAAINRLNIGSKLFKTGADVLRAGGRYTKMAGSVDKALNVMSKAGPFLPTTGKSANLWTATMANTIFEAAAESQGAMEAFIADPKNEEAISERASQLLFEMQQEFPDTPVEELQAAATDKAGKEIAAEVGRDVFLFNVAVLVGPNAVMSKMLWGTKAVKARGIRATESGLEMAPKASLTDRIGRIAGTGATAAGREGFFEEGMQTTGENYISDAYSNNTEYSVGSFVQAYGDMLASTEGQKAIFLGGVFGGGMQTIAAVNNEKLDKKRTAEVVALGNKQIEDMYNVLNEDIYQRNEDGSVKLDPDGKPAYDVENLKRKLVGAQELEETSAMYDIAIEQGDNQTVDAIREAVVTNLVLPFIVDQSLGLDVLREHLKVSKDIAKIAEREGTSAEAYIEQIMDKAKTLEAAHKTFGDFATDVINVQHKDAKEEDYTKFYNRLNTSYVINKSRNHYLTRKLKETNEKLDKVLAESGITRDQLDNNFALERTYTTNDSRISKLREQAKEYKEALDQVKKEADKMWSQGESNKAFASQVNGRVQFEKDLETEAAAAEQALADIENAKTPTEVDDVLDGKPKDKDEADEAKRKAEEAAVKEVTDSIDADGSLANLKFNMNKLNELGISTFSVKKIFNSIEKRIAETIKAQQALSDYLEKVFDELVNSIDATRQTIKDVEQTIRDSKFRRLKLIRELKTVNRNPRGRNAKKIKAAIAETEAEVRRIEVAINSLEKEKDRLLKEIIELEQQIDYIALRQPQIKVSDFTSVDDIVKFLEDNSAKLGNHKFELGRLLIHHEYAGQNLTAIEDLLESLEDYKDVLETTLLAKLKEAQSNPEDVAFLQSELEHVNGRVDGLTKKLNVEKAKLDRLEKAIIHKQAIKSLTKELEFWKGIQKRKDSIKKPKSLANPIVSQAANNRKEKLAQQEAKKAEENAILAEQAKEHAEAMLEAKNQGILNAKYYYDYIVDNLEVGEAIPTPPADVSLPSQMRELPADVPYVLGKKTDNAITITRGNRSFKLSATALGGKKVSAPTAAKETEQTGPRDPLYNTEGAVVEKILEAEEVTDAHNNLEQIGNDARVITGTDQGVNLPYVPKAMIEFERAPRNKKESEVRFEINTTYRAGNQGKALEILEKAKQGVSTSVLPSHIQEARFVQQGTNFEIEIKGEKKEFLLVWNRNNSFPTLFGNKKADGSYTTTDAFPTKEEVQALVDKYVPKDLVALLNEWAEASKLPNEKVLDVQAAVEKKIENKLKSKITGIAPADIDFLIDHLPINAVFNETSGAKAPLETLSTIPEYNEVFNKSSKDLRTAIIKEMVLNGTDIKDISTTIAGQKPGQIQVAPKVEGKVVENSVVELKEFSGDISKIKNENIYVVNDKKVLENYKGKQYPIKRDLAPGEVYIMIKTNTGTLFPLKLNIKRVAENEADLLYDLYKFRLDRGYKETPKSTRIEDTDPAIVAKVQEVFAKELGKDGLFTKNKKTIKDLTIGDIVDFLIWDGTSNIKSQVKFYKDHVKVMGDTYSPEEFAGAREAFVRALTSSKRRNIFFKRSNEDSATSFDFENRAYVEYLFNNKILNTNAVTGVDSDGNYIPTFQGDTTIYLNTNTVRVNKGISQYNVAKKVTFRDKLRGLLSDLKKDLKGLFTETLVLVGDTHYKSTDPKNKLNYQRISSVTSEKAEKEDLGTPMYYNAAKRGDVVDALFRDFFSVGIDTEEAFVAKGKEVLKKVNQDKSKFGDLIMSENLFKELFTIAQEYAIEFNRRGYTIYSTTNPLWGWLRKGGKNTPTAGSMDLLAKDENGRYIIIDIKSSTLDRYENYQREDGFYKEKDLRQQNGYRELFYQRTRVQIDDILILPITFKAQEAEGTKKNSIYTNVTRTKSPTMFIEVDTSRDIYQIMGEERNDNIDRSDPTKGKGKSKGYDRNAWGDVVKDAQDNPDAKSLDTKMEGAEMWEAAVQEGMEEADASFEDMMLRAGIDPSKFGIEPTKKGAKVTKPTPAKAAAVKKPTVGSGTLVRFEVDGKPMDAIVWSSGNVTDKETKKPITDPKIIEAAIAATEKTPTEIRKDEKKSVSLQENKEFVDKIDVNKLTDQEANKALISLIRIRSLGATIGKDIRTITTDASLTKQEQLQKALDLVLDQAAANEEVKEFCNQLNK